MSANPMSATDAEPVVRTPVYGAARVRRAFVHFATGRVIQALGRAALVLVLVRVLTTRDFGAYMLLIGLAEMMLHLVSFGLLPVGRRYLPHLVGTVQTRVLVRFVSLLVAAQLGVLMLATAGIWYMWSALQPVMGLSDGQMAAAAIAVWLFLLVPAVRFACEMLEALLEHGKSRSVSVFMVMGRLAGIGMVLALGIDVDLRAVLLIDVVVTTVCLVLGYILLLHSLATLPAGEQRHLPLRDMVRFGWHMAAVDLMGSTSSPGAIRLALANALGVVESGLFAFLQSLQRLIGRYLPGILLRGLVMPVLLARARQPGGMAIVESGAGLLVKVDLMIIAVGAVVIANGGDLLVAWLSGGKFQGAGLTLLLMYLTLAVISQRAIVEMVMQIVGHTSALRATACIAPVALIAVWLLAENGLDVAVLIILTATALANAIAASVLVRRGFHVDWRGQIVIYVSAASAIGLGEVFRSLEAGAAVSGSFSILAFVTLQLVLRPFREGEISLVEKGLGQSVLMSMLGRLSRRSARKSSV